MNKSVNSLGANEILELIFIYLTEISSRRDYDEILELLTNMGRALTHAAETLVAIKSTKENDDTQKEVVFTTGIGESQLKETDDHVKRVAEYSKLLALEYALSEAELWKEASPYA